MNEQGVSEIFFEEMCTVDADQTARRLFSRLAHGKAYAHQLLEGLATGYLVSLVESVCIREMLRFLDPIAEVIVGSAIDIQHRGPVPPGKQFQLRGWTSQLCERKATFTIEAFDEHEVICQGTLTLVAASRHAIEQRLARKL